MSGVDVMCGLTAISDVSKGGCTVYLGEITVTLSHE
jgi:hypothetical protein